MSQIMTSAASSILPINISNLTGATQYALLVGTATGALSSLAVAGNGEIPIGSVGANPVLGNITSPQDLLVTNGAGTISLDLTSNLRDTAMHSCNGTTLEWADMTVTTAGAVVTFSIEKSGGGDLTAVFSDGYYDWDCTPVDTVTLTAGSDTSPQVNYVYFDQGTKTLTANTSGMPYTEIVPIARILCQSAVSIGTNGVYSLHSCRGSVNDTTDKGLTSILTCWVARSHANWLNGVGQTLTITPNGGAADNVIFTSAAGIVVKLARRTFPAFVGTPDVYTVNDSVTPYNIVTDLNGLLTDSTGAAMSGRYFSLVIWGVINENTGDCKLMVNLPGGSYGTQARLLADNRGYANYSIPSEFKGTGFLIYQMDLRHQTAASGTWTSIQNLDLRGLFPSTAAGGSTAFATIFEDNTFRIVDEGDNTKELAFECSPITTATTRTITMDDRNIDMDAVPDTVVSDAGNCTPSIGSFSIVGAGTVSTSAAGSVVTITGTAGGIGWTIITADLNPMIVDSGYICNKAGLLTLTLPTTAAVGTIQRVTGINTDLGWKIAQSANQIIHFNGASTTTGVGGSVASTLKRDSIELVCVATDLEWNCISMTGNLTIV